MRKFMLSTLVISIAFTSFAQDSLTRKHHTKASYLKKSKREKIVGVSFLTVGAIGLLASFAGEAVEGAATSIASELTPGGIEPSKNSSAGGYLVSGMSLIGGMIFLGVSAETRQKAVSMTMGMEKTEVLRYGAICKRSFPAVGLKIRM